MKCAECDGKGIVERFIGRNRINPNVIEEPCERCNGTGEERGQPWPAMEFDESFGEAEDRWDREDMLYEEVRDLSVGKEVML